MREREGVERERERETDRQTDRQTETERISWLQRRFLHPTWPNIQRQAMVKVHST